MIPKDRIPCPRCIPEYGYGDNQRKSPNRQDRLVVAVFQPLAGLNFEHHTYGDSMQVIDYSCQVLGAENRFAVGTV
jgi:hypothetical protein